MTKREKKAYWKGFKGLYDRLKREQEAGRSRSESCEICNKICDTVFDHNHKTGKFRGWICKQCNAALGMVYDNPHILFAMISYLKKDTQ